MSILLFYSNEKQEKQLQTVEGQTRLPALEMNPCEFWIFLWFSKKIYNLSWR